METKALLVSVTLGLLRLAIPLLAVAAAGMLFFPDQFGIVLTVFTIGVDVLVFVLATRSLGRSVFAG
jgi:hypothetical protein